MNLEIIPIDVFSDLVCPWCYVGKRRLEAALAERPALRFVVRWLPFELNPELPAEGMPRAEYLRMRFGDANRFAAVQVQLVELGRGLDIDFRFSDAAWLPNTRRAHALLQRVGSTGSPSAPERQGRLQERLMAGHFSAGENLSDPELLVRAAVEVGCDEDMAHAALVDETVLEQVVSLEHAAQKAGISGVPTFIFAGRYAFSGAQEPAAFLEVFDQLRTDGGGQSTSA
ncbi:MAG: DsbA family oxidoreductase [Steroidobacteraceae bacterium]